MVENELFTTMVFFLATIITQITFDNHKITPTFILPAYSKVQEKMN